MVPVSAYLLISAVLLTVGAVGVLIRRNALIVFMAVELWWAALGVGGVILSVVYLLWAYQQVMHGPLVAKDPEHLVDLTPRELLVFVPLVALIFAIGLYPKPLLDRSEAAVGAALARLERPAAKTAPPASRVPPPESRR